MPHAALFVVQEIPAMGIKSILLVSMPHAALFVVQDFCYTIFAR